ncbi:MAG: hypothetical protein IKO32_07655, partial [Lachnospiraceae bacterium]|nr:hypothetical protein [Lachnospiraceae bacterium]
MLSKILKKESCAACRFCCVFRRQSLWETPIFTKENEQAIRDDLSLDASSLIPAGKEQEYYRYDLSEKYQTDDSEEEAPCPYLGEKGCI